MEREELLEDWAPMGREDIFVFANELFWLWGDGVGGGHRQRVGGGIALQWGGVLVVRHIVRVGSDSGRVGRTIMC